MSKQLGQIDKLQFNYQSFVELMKKAIYIGKLWAVVPEETIDKDPNMDFGEALAFLIWKDNAVIKFCAPGTTEFVGDMSIEKVKSGLQIVAQNAPGSFTNIIKSKPDFYDADIWLQATLLGSINKDDL